MASVVHHVGILVLVCGAQPSRVLAGPCRSRLAPRALHCLGCFLAKRLLMTAVAHHRADLADIAELFGWLQQADLGTDDLLLVGHGGVRRERRGRPRLRPQPIDTVCRFQLLQLVLAMLEIARGPVAA